MSRIPTLLLLLIFPGLLLAQEERALVVVFGDSITSESGYPGSSSGSRARNGALNSGLPSSELTTILNESERPSLVPNWGHGGTPSGRNQNGEGEFNGVERISGNLASSRGQYPSDQYFVLIIYGTNDPNFGIPSGDTGFNTRVMIDSARGQGFEPIIGTLTPRTDFSVGSINNAIAAAASARNATLVDIFTKFNNAGGFSLLLDGLHPNSTGYNVIANIWFDEYLENAIEPLKSDVVLAPINLLLLDD